MWFYAAALASILSGFLVVLAKKTLKNVSPAVFYWATITISTPITIVVALTNDIPRINLYFIIGILGSVSFYTVSKILTYRVIRDSDLSSVYPLIALSPIVTLIISVLPPLSERPASLAVIGALISILGSYILNISSAREGLLKPFQVLLKNKLALVMLLSVFIVGFVSAFDKFAINNTFPTNSIFALLAEDVVIVFGMLPYVFRKRDTFVKEISSNKVPLILFGTILAIGNILAFFAIEEGSVGIVTAIIRTQILFALLFGFVILKDKPRLETIIGTIIMIAGVIAIKLGS